MNGYLMQERQWTPGEDLFAESFSPESPYGVVFEDDGQTAYFYAVEKDKEGTGLRVLDALHIRETGEDAEASDTGSDSLEVGQDRSKPEEGEDSRASDSGSDSAVVGQDRSTEEDETADEVGEGDELAAFRGATPKPSRLQIVWSKDWMKSALVIDGLCHALFDFIAHGGYNINQFPPPNEFWTQGDRRLTMELMQKLF